MKSKKTFPVALALTMSTACFSIPNAYAEDLYLHGYRKVNSTYFLATFTKDTAHHFNNLNARDYFNGAAEKVVEKDTAFRPTGFNFVKLPTNKKRDYVYKLQKYGAVSIPEDIVLNSRKEADDFCNYIIWQVTGMETTPKLYADALYVSPYQSTAPGFRRTIAVPYLIAYGETSELDVETGKSTPAKKHVFCPNPWEKDGWKLDPKYADENESKDIREATLRDTGQYDVTCMNGSSGTFLKNIHVGDQWIYYGQGKSYSFTASEANEHVLNKFVGANFCPMS